MSTALRTTTNQTIERDLRASMFLPDQIALIKSTIAKGASEDELALFLAQCQRTGLDPFSRQIYWIKRGATASTQVSIDGFRVIAEKSGEMDGQEVAWCGEDGAWVDVWLHKAQPAAARVLVYRKGCAKPFPGIARWTEYAQSSPLWTRMGANMLAKCAEALALRKAFPHQLSGLYTQDEMEQAWTHVEPVIVEAPAAERPPLPVGACYLVRVRPQSRGTFSWAEVTFVNHVGEEVTLPTKADGIDGAVSLCEQLVAEGKPVRLETSVGPRNGKTTISKIERWSTEAVEAEVVSEPVTVL